MTRKNRRLIQDVQPHGMVFDDRSEVERNEGMPVGWRPEVAK